MRHVIKGLHCRWLNHQSENQASRWVKAENNQTSELRNLFSSLNDQLSIDN